MVIRIHYDHRTVVAIFKGDLFVWILCFQNNVEFGVDSTGVLEIEFLDADAIDCVDRKLRVQEEDDKTEGGANEEDEEEDEAIAAAEALHATESAGVVVVVLMVTGDVTAAGRRSRQSVGV